jgi:hypothetical protein
MMVLAGNQGTVDSADYTNRMPSERIPLAIASVAVAVVGGGIYAALRLPGLLAWMALVAIVVLVIGPDADPYGPDGEDIV